MQEVENEAEDGADDGNAAAERDGARKNKSDQRHSEKSHDLPGN